MLKKIFMAGSLTVFVFLSSGCGTLYNGAQGIKNGAQEDWSWLTKAVKDSDAWARKNLW